MHGKYKFLTLGKEPFFPPFNIPSLHSTWKMGRFPAWAPHQKKKKNGAFFRKTTQLFQRHSSCTQAQGASPAQPSFNVENGAFPSLGSPTKKKKMGLFSERQLSAFSGTQRYSSPGSREQAPPREQAQPEQLRAESKPRPEQVASPPRGIKPSLGSKPNSFSGTQAQSHTR